jgi:putative endonuclease
MGKTETKEKGDAGERRALDHLVRHGLRPLARNFRVAAGPGAPAGEVDLILRDRDGTVVFVEVRVRRDGRHGGAAASVGPAKQRRVRLAARHWLRRYGTPPPCRFDVVVIEGDDLVWLPGAFDDLPATY